MQILALAETATSCPCETAEGPSRCKTVHSTVSTQQQPPTLLPLLAHRCANTREESRKPFSDFRPCCVASLLPSSFRLSQDATIRLRDERLHRQDLDAIAESQVLPQFTTAEKFTPCPSLATKHQVRSAVGFVRFRDRV